MADLVETFNAITLARLAYLENTDACRKLWSEDDGSTFVWNTASLFASQGPGIPAVDMTHFSPINSRTDRWNGGSVISRNFIALAAHVGNLLNDTFKLVAPDNSVDTRTITAWRQVPGTDLLIAKFDQPILETITPAKRFSSDFATHCSQTYTPSYAGERIVPWLTTPLLVFFINGAKQICVGQLGQVCNGFIALTAATGYEAYYGPNTQRDSGNLIFVVTADGTPVTLANLLGWVGGPSQADRVTQTNALMDEMGGTAADHVQIEDVSAFDTYAAPEPPVQPPPYIPPQIGASGVSTTYKIYADGTGDFLTFAAFMADETAYLTAGTVIFEYQGTYDQLGDISELIEYMENAEEIYIVPKAGGEASPVAGVGHSFGRLTTGSVWGSNTMKKLVVRGTGVGRPSMTLNPTSLELVDFSDVRFFDPTSVSGANQIFFAITIGSSGRTVTFNLGNAIFCGVNPTAATNYGLVSIAGAGGANVNLNLDQCDLDGSYVKGNRFVAIIAAGTNGTINLAMRNTILAGSTMSMSLSGNVVIAEGSGGNLATGTLNTALNAVAVDITPAETWVDPAAFNYTLKAGSPAINVATTSPVALDMLGNARPRTVGTTSIVDAGVVQFVVGAITLTTTDGITWDFADVTGAATYKHSEDGGTTWSEPFTSSNFTLTSPSSTLAYALDTNGEVIAIGAGSLLVGNARTPAGHYLPWLKL